MTAKQMFEELGYEQTVYSGFSISYFKKNYGSKIKFIYGDNKVHINNYESRAFSISMELLKAINKQIEELGWDNETN